ncbi:MAG: hypothetical protein A2660_03015 [Candidatus Doudnabacteria bacterium RIFCSPHIGHO2_01_FULL_45_18]|uniref:Phosphoribosyltransferase domain-containing protein n=1 Tax=Candidatus Doudnabacteria bacterium RIFCSPHIGHO2_01_FULL_45_18 TaxID=1817823 RepID=A0A1F5NQA5_9BACT|nr:MAG: hypothetical protein A2660_03015 [Candidatus Doudnabacteria bacterium RIFCSPHIGHO2_01_FULL_45_18]
MDTIGITKLFKKLGQAILDLVFPIACLVCSVDGTYLCQKCHDKLARLAKQKCLVCQKPSPFGKTHPECRTKNSVDGAIAALDYKNRDVQKIIETFKYNFVSDLAVPLSELLVEAIKSQNLSEYFQDFIIVPIPLHTRRHNWRGFNQALLLSQTLSEHLNIPLQDQLVRRHKFTKPQTTLNAEARKKNIENAFELSGNPENKKILLVDDVVTSGSTANELAKLLKRGKAAEVWILTSAHG